MASLAPGDMLEVKESNFGTSISNLSETVLFIRARSRLLLMNENRLMDFHESKILRHESLDPNLVMLSIISRTLSSFSTKSDLKSLWKDTANLCFMIGFIVWLFFIIDKVPGKRERIVLKSSFLKVSQASFIMFARAARIGDKRLTEPSLQFR